MHRHAILVLGLWTAISAFPHALLGWPPFASQLAALGANADLADGLAVGWWFGSLAFLMMGVLVLLAWREIDTSPLAWRVVLAIGATIAFFGAAALVYRSGDPFFIGFVVSGGLLAASALRARSALAR